MLSKPVAMTCGCTVTTVSILDRPLCHTHLCNQTLEPWQPEPGPRMARCGQCGRLEPTHDCLPFFQNVDDSHEDRFYCGCRGWN